jgi:hypothetical protein
LSEGAHHPRNMSGLLRQAYGAENARKVMQAIMDTIE